MATPTDKDIFAYKGNDLSIIWDFVDANDNSAIDINDVYDSITFKIYKRNNEANPEIEYTIGSGLTVSSTNRLTATLTDSQNDSLRSKFLYFKLIVKVGTTDKTFQTGNYTVYDNVEGAQTDTGFTLSIDNSTQVTEIQTSGLYAEALAELAKVTVPDTVILVDGGLTQNENPAFDNIDDAVTAAYAVIAGGASKVVIRAYANSSGVPYTLDGYDYYTLRDSGIYFESPFDTWKNYVTNGGNFDANDLLYTIDLNEIVLTIDPN
jgi:hypothetical protein